MRNLQRHSLVERQESDCAAKCALPSIFTDRLVFETGIELERGDLKLVHRYALLTARQRIFARASTAAFCNPLPNN
ncbi:MAG: hypothetical protein R2932_60220 [Caldilineaceae bacterium]